jgi:hypothetical protein
MNWPPEPLAVAYSVSSTFSYESVFMNGGTDLVCTLSTQRFARFRRFRRYPDTSLM